MDYQEILEPVAQYRDHLKAEHAENTSAAFEELLAQSGVDEALNVEKVKNIRILEEAVRKLSSKTALFGFLRGLAIFIAVVSSIMIVLYILQAFNVISDVISNKWGMIAIAAAVVSYTLIFGWLNSIVKKFNALLQAKQEELDAAMADAWEQMRPLNDLFQWNTIAKIVMKTMPILELDTFFSQSRMNQLVDHFLWCNFEDESQSIVCCQSGAINGNPLVIADSFNQTWGEKTYEGSLTITWREYDSYEKKTVTKTETLHASVTKPIPEYFREKFLIYGNEAAPDLKFSRSANELSSAGSGMLGRMSMRNAIKKLENMSRDLKTDFTIMDNREFDACFNAVDRNNEQQFRLLFTPLAQQEMLKILQDDSVGYGDDFAFVKCHMINTVVPSHLQSTDISGSPSIFQNYELAAVRRLFNEYSNDFFRSFFFSIAPLLAIPLYQQHRSTLDIYKDVYNNGVSFFEYESLANSYADGTFAPSRADTPSILKTQLLERDCDKSRIKVTAHAYHGEDRVEYVRVFGGDNRWHNVPVPWIEYLPITRERQLTVRAIPGDTIEESARELYSDKFTRYFNSYGVNYGDLQWRRNLISFFAKN